MRNHEFNTALQTLLKAFTRHDDLRQNGADVSTLAKSRHELYKAGMAAHHLMR